MRVRHEEDLAGRFTGSSYWDVPDPIATSRRVGVLEDIIRVSAGMYGSEILTAEQEEVVRGVLANAP